MNFKDLKNFKNSSGFTLIEILLVIGIIAVLAAVVIVALDPAKRFQDAQDSRRLSDIQSILSAVQQYIVDNKGTLPPGIEATELQIGTASDGCERNDGRICAVDTGGCLNLSSDLARYLKTMPYDPVNGSTDTTHYSIQVDENNIVTVRACDANDMSISSVSR